MKEIWELATSPQVLPFTLLLIPIALYWTLAIIGLVDLDFLDIDLDADLDLDATVDASVDTTIDTSVDAPDGGLQMGTDVDAAHHPPGAGVLHGALRVIGATDVPIMAILSIIVVLLWALTMLGNLWLNPEQAKMTGTIIGVSALVGAVILARIITLPLRPFFRAFKKSGSINRPVVGRTGKVRSRELTEDSGQVLIEEKGDELFLNARLMAGSAPLEKGAEVLIYKYDKESGIYYVRSLTEPSDT